MLKLRYAKIQGNRHLLFVWAFNNHKISIGELWAHTYRLDTQLYSLVANITMNARVCSVCYGTPSSSFYLPSYFIFQLFTNNSIFYGFFFLAFT